MDFTTPRSNGLPALANSPNPKAESGKVVLDKHYLRGQR